MLVTRLISKPPGQTDTTEQSRWDPLAGRPWTANLS